MTGGDSGAALEGIRAIVTNPEAYNILPFKHNHTPSGDYIFSAMFIPAYRNLLSLTDNRGWCNLQAAKDEYEKERLKKIGDPKGLLIYKAEYCFTIEEALIQGGDNIFPREELAEQEAHITIYKDVPEPVSGHLVWNTDGDKRLDGVKWRASRTDDPGKIWILEHPEISENKTAYKNLYVGGIDSIDIGSKDSASEDGKVSDFCIVIKKRILGMQEPKYVAMYKDRPKDIREAYDIAAKLLTYYGCQAVLESTRTAILTYFRDKKYMHLLMKRPRSTMPDVTKSNSNMYGSPATAKVINHYRELIYDFCLDYSHTICFLPMIHQLLNYSDEKKKDFDIVASLGMAELGDEELSTKAPVALDPPEQRIQDVGYWKDSKGYRHYGAIPLTKEERDVRTRVGASDSWLYKDDL